MDDEHNCSIEEYVALMRQQRDDREAEESLRAQLQLMQRLQRKRAALEKWRGHGRALLEAQAELELELTATDERVAELKSEVEQIERPLPEVRPQLLAGVHGRGDESGDLEKMSDG